MMTRRIAGPIFAAVSLVALAGCVTDSDLKVLEDRITALEARTNDAMRTARTANVDARTALMLATQEK